MKAKKNSTIFFLYVYGFPGGQGGEGLTSLDGHLSLAALPQPRNVGGGVGGDSTLDKVIFPLHSNLLGGGGAVADFP